MSARASRFDSVWLGLPLALSQFGFNRLLHLDPLLGFAKFANLDMQLIEFGFVLAGPLVVLMVAGDNFFGLLMQVADLRAELF
jgi:hypothetical protein